MLTKRMHDVQFNIYVSLLHLKGCWPAVYRPDDSLQKLSVLDPNHTHFILVDDGTQPTYYKDNDLRSKLEKHVSQMNTDGSRGRSLVVIAFFICNLSKHARTHTYRPQEA